MSKTYQVGTKVKWKWSNGYGHGKISESFTEKVTRTISGSDVTRNATEDEPADIIEQEDGDRVLKSHSELEKDSQASRLHLLEGRRITAAIKRASPR